MALLTTWTSLDMIERVPRCHSSAMGARLLARPKADPLVNALRRAEADANALPTCDTELRRLATVTMRRPLSTFATTLR